MFFIANLQPRLLNVDRGTGFLTIKEKKEIIEKFEEKKKNGLSLNLCKDHAGGKKEGFELSKDSIIGKVNEMILNKKGELMITGELEKNNEIAKSINREMFFKKEDYGVSLWLDLKMNNKSKSIDDLWLKKELNHVALTTKPGLGKYGSYIIEWGIKKEKIDEILRDKYFNLNEKNNDDEINKQIYTKEDNQKIDIDSNENFKYASKELLERWKKGIF